MSLSREKPTGYDPRYFHDVCFNPCPVDPIKSIAWYNTFQQDTREVMAAYDVVTVIKKLSKEEQEELLTHVSRICPADMINEFRVKTILAIRSIPQTEREKFTTIVISLFTFDIAGHDRMWLTKMLAESKFDNARLEKFSSQVYKLFSPQMNGNDRSWIVNACIKKSEDEMAALVKNYLTIFMADGNTDAFTKSLIKNTQDIHFKRNQVAEKFEPQGRSPSLR